MARTLLKVLATLLALPFMAVAGIWIWLQFDEPTPVEELLDGEPSIDLAEYDGSDPVREGARSILILGVPHFAQIDHDYPSEAFDEVVDALARFDPDLVAVEHLPPDWPRGEGRDYRPDLDVESYADRWALAVNEANAIVEGEAAADGPCERGRAYLLTYDLANAYHQWAAHGCEELTIDDDLTIWSAQLEEDEIARIASPVAWDRDVEELVSFDYQGEDARWFIHEEAITLEALTSPGALWQMLPEVNRRTRELSGHDEAHDDRLVDRLHHLNSPERVALQYWGYEQAMPQLEVRDVGERQRDSYWRRNQGMFDLLHDAVEEQDAERTLVVVGAGHRYFLDELARDHGYRWVDPREWLPEPR